MDTFTGIFIIFLIGDIFELFKIKKTKITIIYLVTMAMVLTGSWLHFRNEGADSLTRIVSEFLNNTFH